MVHTVTPDVAKAGTEHLLFGMLLAAETTGNANAASKICKGAEIIGQLQAACNVSAAQLIAAGRKCPGGVRQFGIIHLDPIAAVASAGAEPLAGGGGGGGGGGEAASASADAGTSAFTVPDAPVNMVGPVPKTHYVYNNLICGHSAGLMKTKDLEGLVDAGVNTFVCLQSSYVGQLYDPTGTFLRDLEEQRCCLTRVVLLLLT